VARSGDSGKTWTTQHTFPELREITGGIAHCGRTLIAQRTLGFRPGALPGLVESIDGGKTWTDIGGPGALTDTRPFTTPCGLVVFAGDTLGGLWRTTGVSGGGAGQALGVDLSAIDFGITSSCTTRDTSFILTATGCGTLTIDSIVFTGAAASRYSIVGVPTPFTLGAGTSAPIGVRYAPRSAGPDTAALGVAYGGGGPAWVVSLSGIGTTPASIATIDSSVEFGIVSTCVPRDSILSITAVGCGPTRVDSILLTGPGAAKYSIGGLALPAEIQPGTSLSVRLRYAPTGKGRDSADVRIAAGGSPSNWFAGLAGTGRIPDTLAVDDSLIDVGDAPRCVGATRAAGIRTDGCDTVRVAFSLAGPDAADFTIVGPATIALVPGISLAPQVRFQPSRLGLESASILVAIGGGLPRPLFVVKGKGLDCPIVISTLDTVAFASATTCDTTSSTLVIHNLSCDSVILDPVRVVGADAAQFVLTGVNRRDTIRSGDSEMISVEFRPPSAGAFAAAAEITAVRDGSKRLVPLSASVGEWPQFSIGIGAIAAEADMSATIPVPIRLVPTRGQSAIDGWSADVKFDPMLLEPVGIDVAGTLSAGATSATFTPTAFGATVRATLASPVLAPAEATLAILNLRVLAGTGDTSNASISIGSAQLGDSGRASARCIDVVLGAAAALRIVPPCSATHVGFAYSSHPFLSMSPNPAGREAVAEIYSNGSSMSIEVVDMMGAAIWKSGEMIIPPGVREIRIPLAAAASGPLVVALRAGSIRESRLVMHGE
jgi:hypothetical protein